MANDDLPPIDGGEAEATRELNSAARAETIRDTFQACAEFDRQIDGLKAERKAVVETNIVAGLGMKKTHFAAAYKLWQAGQQERDELFDVIRECHRALGADVLDWADAAG